MSHPVADRPFVDQPPDLDAARRFAEQVARDGGLVRPQLLNAGMNAIFRCGRVVLRVSHLNGPPASAYDLADALTESGVRVARPAEGRLIAADAESGLTATAWEYLPSTGGEVDWIEVGAMVRRVRDLGAVVPVGYPAPMCTSYPWWQFESMLAELGPEIERSALAGLRRAVDENAGWVRSSGGEDAWALCHGDVHPANVIAGRDGPVIIDWDLLCVGPPGWDHAPLRSMVARWGARPESYAAFARGYGEDLSADPVTGSLTTLRLVAATLMRVKAGRTSATAKAETERRLRFWRGEADAPIWAMS